MPNKKNNTVQMVRGVCIISVILIHCVNGMSYKYDKISYWYSIITRQFINFPVGVFIFFAGYFAKYENFKISDFKKRIIRLCIPYLVWSVIYLAINYIFKNDRIDFFRAIRRIMAGGCQIHLYFILVLVQMTIITPFVAMLYKRNKKYHYLFLVITPLHFLAICLYRYLFNSDMPLKATVFTAWFLFYWLGLYCNIEKKNSLINRQAMPVLFGVILSCAGGILLEKIFSYDLAVSQIKISSCILTVAIINVILHNKEKIVPKQHNVLVKLGDISYGIYYVHMVGILITSHIIEMYSLTAVLSLPVIQILQLIFTLGLSVCIIIVTKKIIGKDLSGKLLGF